MVTMPSGAQGCNWGIKRTKPTDERCNIIMCKKTSLLALDESCESFWSALFKHGHDHRAETKRRTRAIRVSTWRAVYKGETANYIHQLILGT
jgi:hypothetical protein